MGAPSTSVPPPGRKPSGPLGAGLPYMGPAAAPPASLPLSFLFAAGVGLFGFGLALAVEAGDAVVGPTLPEVVATVHLAMLAFLSMAVLGAAHQFGPVVAGGPLRSVTAGRVTMAGFTIGAWLLPYSFAAGNDTLLVTAGLIAFSAVCLAAWNLSGPLSLRVGGAPIEGLRWSVGFFVLTATFGVVYAFDLRHGWFALYSHVVLAHAHLGLIGWLGLSYVAVAEKLWPMFLLSHRPTTRSATVAIRLIPPGVLVLATGLLFGWTPVAVAGAVLVAGGIGGHFWSLGGFIRHRKRNLELLHAFILTSAALLVTAVAFGLVAGLADVSSTVRSRMVSAEIAALVGWLGLAIIGHVHKIVPFIGWTALRAKGVHKKADGKPLLFADLFDGRVARVTYLTATVGTVALPIGFATATAGVVTAAGVALALTSVLVVANLSLGPSRAVRAARQAEVAGGATVGGERPAAAGAATGPVGSRTTSPSTSPSTSSAN